MEKNITLEKDNITYKLNLKLVSKIIVFHVEFSEFPKRIFESGFPDSVLNCKHASFSLYEDIEKKFEFLKYSLKEPSKIIIEEKDNLLKIQIPSPLTIPLKNLPPMIFEIDEKKDINVNISELYSLYKELKIEKEKEINDLIQRNKENEEKLEKKLEKMNNEIKDLKDEIKNLKEQIKKDKKELENDYNKKIKDYEESNKIQHKNIENKLEKSDLNIFLNKNKLTELKNSIDKIDYSLQNKIWFLTVKNLNNFKTIFEEYYKQLTKKNNSKLFREYYKPSFNIIVEIIFEHMKRDKEKDNRKVMELSDGEKYENYFFAEWNWFLINNVIYQMIFCDIELSENGVEEALKNIYKWKPDFEIKYKSQLEWAKNDIEAYIKDFEIGKVIKKIKISKKNLLPGELEKNLLGDNE